MIDARVVRDFLLGKVSARALADAATHAYTQTGVDTRRLNWRELNEDFVVSRDHLVRLTDAVVGGDLPAQHLEPLAFGIIADDHFSWDSETPEGNRVGKVLYDWSSPEINYQLTVGTVSKYRHFLLTGEDTFTKADFGSPSA